MASKNKNIIVFVVNLLPRMVDDIHDYEKLSGKKFRILLLWDSKFKRPTDKDDLHDILVECDLSKPHKIAEALLPYQDELLAVTCRGDGNISRFAKVIPHVPYLRTPTSESLYWATDKYEMRKRFKLFSPKHTPKFTWVQENSKQERKRVIEKLGFPMVVKPASLGGSLLVTICYHEDEFEKALRTVFRKINKAYRGDKRSEEPKVIAEEYMDGDMYSVDSYVNSRGEIYHCPLVRSVTGKNIGHDDFYTYSQTTPTALKKASIEKAQEAAEAAIHALGLRSTSAHTELMRVDEDWKIIEIGARLGGFRDILHDLSCDINHTMNDIFIRIPRKPVIPKKCKGFATVIKWFSDKEGKILEMKGIKKIEYLESFHNIVVNKKVGDRAVFARNGGRSIFNLFLYNKDRSKLLADIRRAEKLVKVKVATRAGQKAAAKKK